MNGERDIGAGRFDWRVEGERAGADALGHGRSLSRRHEARANSLGLIITTSIFFVLLAATIMFGGHAAIGPLLKRAVGTPSPTASGDLVFAMPDGMFCRHMSYDNATGNLVEEGIVRCPERPGGKKSFESPEFKWGAH